MERNESIWVICAEGENHITEHSFQMLGKARKLKGERNLQVTAVVIGNVCKKMQRRLFKSGATNIHLCQFKRIGSTSDTSILVKAIDEHRPELIMFPATLLGKKYAAEIAPLVGAGLTADCIDVQPYVEGSYLFKRAAINDSVIASIVCVNTDIQMCTVKEDFFIKEKEYPDNGIITKHRYELKTSYLLSNSISLLQRELIKIERNEDIKTAKLVFAFGRGVDEKRTLPLLKRVASNIGAEIVGSRAVVEDDLLDKERQVGQSGINICPQIYVAFGISGAIQHMVGLNNAKIIIAINIDAKAPIFDYADYSVVADCYSFLSEMERLISKREARVDGGIQKK